MNFRKIFLNAVYSVIFITSILHAQEADTSFRHYIIDKGINVSRINLSKEELGFYKSSDLNSTEEILNRLGISFIRRGNYAPEPVIRGLNTNQTDITINGMKIMPACTDKMDPVTSYVETENLGEIEIESGTGTGSLLSNSGGKIDLGLYTPKFSESFRYNGNIKSGYQLASENYKGSFNLNLTDKKFSINVNTTFNASGDYKKSGGIAVWNSGFKKYNFSLNGSYKLKSKDLLNINGIIDDAYDVGYPALLMDVGSAKARIIGLDYQADNFIKFFNNMRFKIYYNKVDHIMDDSRRQNGFRMDMPGKTETFGSSLTGSVYFDSKTQLTSGFEFTNSLISADMTMYFSNNIPMYMVTWPDIRKNAINSKFSLLRSVTDNLTVSPFFGFGYQNSDIGNIVGFNSLQIFYSDLEKSSSRNLFSGGVKISQRITNSVLAELTASYSERFPTASEEFGFYLYNKFDNYDYIGNPELKNESSYQLNLGVDYSKHNLSFKTNVFGYFFSDYIMGVFDNSVSAMTPGSNGVKFYSNTGNALITGFEMNLMLNLSEKFSLVTIVNYIYGKEFNEDPLPLIPPLNSTFSIRYSNKNYFIQLEEILNAPQNRVSKRNSESASAGYAISNLRVTDRINKWFSISGGIENIFDKEYYNHLDWLKIPQKGRNIYCDLKISF